MAQVITTANPIVTQDGDRKGNVQEIIAEFWQIFQIITNEDDDQYMILAKLSALKLAYFRVVYDDSENTIYIYQTNYSHDCFDELTDYCIMYLDEFFD